MAVYLERRNGKPTGKWYGETTYEGVRYRKRFNSHAEGQGYVDYIEATGHEPGDTQNVVGATFATAAKEAQEQHTKWHRCRDKSLGQRMAFLVDKLGPVAVSNITYKMVQDKIVLGLNKRPGRGKGDRMNPKTINRYLAVLSVVLYHAVLNGHMKAAPELPWQETTDKKMQWFSYEQEEGVKTWMQENTYLAHALSVRILCDTGLRWGEFEAVAGDPAMIDFVKVVDGSTGLETGEEVCWVRLWENKTDHPRSVPIVPSLAREWLGMIRSGHVPDYSHMYKVVKRACEMRGYSKDLTIHSFRHTAATRVLESSKDPKLSQEMLGHRALATTNKYLHISNDRLQGVVKNLSREGGKLDKSAEIVQLPSRKSAS